MGLRLLPCLVLLIAACSNQSERPLSEMTTPELLLRARTMRGGGNLAAAIVSYRMVLHRDSLNADALGGLATVYRAQGKARASERYLRKAVYLTYTRGLATLEEGDSTTAAAAFEHTLELLPRHPLALVRLGDMARGRSDVDGAVELYRRAAGANPDYAESYIKLGDACIEAGLDSEARDAYESAIQANLNAFEAYMGLARLDAAGGAWAGAAEQYRKALLIRPQSAAARSGLSRARQNL